MLPAPTRDNPVASAIYVIGEAEIEAVARVIRSGKLFR